MKDTSKLDKHGNLVEEKVSTTVRGVKFTLSAAIINKILKIENPPPVPEFSYTNQEVYETLIPGKPFPPDQALKLSFKPSDMPQEHRVLWYIYSRNFVPKAGNYTHFTSLDYRPFTAFVKKVPFNLGDWLLQGMKSFRFAKKELTHIPYPSLVSVILFYHKIWYVGSTDTLEYPLFFGKHQLNLMKIKFDAEGQAQSQASMAPDEAQSAPPPPQSTMPSDILGQIQQMIDHALNVHQAVMKAEIDVLRADIKLGIMDVVVAQTEVVSHLHQLKEEVDQKLTTLDTSLAVALSAASDARDKAEKLIHHFGLGTSSDAPGPSTAPAPSSSPAAIPATSPVHSPATTPILSPATSPVHSPPSHSFAFPSPPHSPDHLTPSTTMPSVATPTTEVLPDPLPSPSTPATVVLPTPSLTPYGHPPIYDPTSDPSFDPTTAMVLYKPPLFVLDPEFLDDDDKGGETSKD